MTNNVNVSVPRFPTGKHSLFGVWTNVLHPKSIFWTHVHQTERSIHGFAVDVRWTNVYLRGCCIPSGILYSASLCHRLSEPRWRVTALAFACLYAFLLRGSPSRDGKSESREYAQYVFDSCEIIRKLHNIQQCISRRFRNFHKEPVCKLSVSNAATISRTTDV